MKTFNINKIKRNGQRVYKSIWFFPIILLLPVLILTAFKINGSSIGIYHSYFYGQQTQDTELLYNKPLPIRSDEWLVNTQMAIAQENAGYPRLNENLGNGQDMSILFDAPYRDWSSVLKPHNAAFFFLPFEFAFAFRWWIMAYLLIIGLYFFIVTLLPGKRIAASLFSISLLFSPFIQWWYLYGTMGSIYYCLFMATIVMKLLKSDNRKERYFWSILLCYVLSCFAVILYPPFQIPCALALIGFSAGYLIEISKKIGFGKALRRISPAILAAALSIIVALSFLASRIEVVRTIQNTAYPGKRVQQSGGYDLTHLMSSQTVAAIQSESRSKQYNIPDHGITNQSEISNFLQIIPLFLLPLFVLAIRKTKSKKFSIKPIILDWPLASVVLSYLILTSWLIIKNVDIFGSVSLLNYVPHQRTLIGIGLLQFIFWPLLIRYMKQHKHNIKNSTVILSTVFAFLIQLFFNMKTNNTFPGFISTKLAILLALPLTLFVLLTLRKKYTLAATIFLIFSLLSSFSINPLYRGTGILRNGEISSSIKELNTEHSGVWLSDVPELKNILIANGVRSLSGVYGYPQLELWKEADPDADSDIYNRFAHVQFNFYRDPETINETDISLASGDNVGVLTEPCGDLMKSRDVTYILTRVKFDNVKADNCLQEIKKISYPEMTIYIYKINFSQQ